MKNSKIEWTHHTVNFWWGCAKVSPACAFCYAAAFAARFNLSGRHVEWGPGKPRVERLQAARNEMLALNAAARKSSARQRVFVNSMSDWLDDEVPTEWRAVLLQTIWRCSWLDVQLLTKRPENWKRLLDDVVGFEPLRDEENDDGRQTLSDWILDWYNGGPPANVWIGTTVEDQTRADERIPALLAIPARVRFLSCEPLLGPVDLTDVTVARTGGDEQWNALEAEYDDDLQGPGPKIDWVICGGESGPGARPMHPEWARSLRDQCAAAGVPFFFKQWGEWVPVNQSIPGSKVSPNDTFPAAKSTVLQLDGRQEFAFPHGAMTCLRVSKKTAGRLLDGVEHSAFPEVRS